MDDLHTLQDLAHGPMPVAEMSDGDRALLEDPAARRVWNWLARRYNDEPLTPDSSPRFDLGLDSMGWMDLTLEIRQRAGVKLTDEAVGNIDTVRALLREVAEQSANGAAVSAADPLEEPEKFLSEHQQGWLRPLGPVETVLAKALHATDKLVMRVLFRLEVRGLEHLPAKGPFVLAPNHESTLDVLAIAAALDGPRLRQTYWAAWTGAAFNNPVQRFLSRLAQLVPIDPDRGASSSLAFGASVLRRDKNLIWFPEGQRTYTGRLQLFKPGLGMLLDRYRVPVVPVYIHGAYEALPRHKRIPRRRKVSLAFGRPLDPDELEREGHGDEGYERITSALRDQVMRLGREAGYEPEQSRVTDRATRRAAAAEHETALPPDRSR